MSTTAAPAAPASSTPVTLLTAEEFAQRYGGQRVELVKGVVKELPMPFPKHGKVCATIARLVGNYVAERDVGHVMSNDSFVKTRSHPDTVRGADVSYYSYERLAKGAVPDGLLPVAPDLVVEVRSPSDGWSAIFTKVGEYLGAGVPVVIVLDGVSQTASVYRPEELQQIFHNGDELVVPELLPGFAVRVSRLFE
jgi:Uma2 family endonuclease